MALESDPALEDLLARVDDQTIAVAIRGVRDLEQRWMAVPPGGTLSLSWPLAPDFFAGTTGSPDRSMTGVGAAQNVPFGRGHPAELSHSVTAPNGDIVAKRRRVRLPGVTHGQAMGGCCRA